MSSDPIGTVHRHLLVRQLAAWGPTALRRSRRATFVQAYDGPDGGTADAAVRSLASFADVPRGARLAVVVLAAGADDLAARLGAAEVGLSADVAVHLIPGDAARLPVAVKAAGGAGAPLLVFVDTAAGPVPQAELRAVVPTGRPAEVLLVSRSSAVTGSEAASVLRAVGLPLVTQVELVTGDGETPAGYVCFGTGSEKGLASFKDAMWSLPASSGVRYRDAAGQILDGATAPDEEPLRRELLRELHRTGPATVNDLRRHTLTVTAYRTSDALGVLGDLVADGSVSRDPADGRLGGEVVLRPIGSPTG